MDEDKGQWLNWCLLCATENCQNKFNILPGDQPFSSWNGVDVTLKQALRKYFSINEYGGGRMPSFLCENCHSFLLSFQKFSERVQRVQQMYGFLVDSSEYCDINLIRTQFQVLDKHIHDEKAFVSTPEGDLMKFGDSSKEGHTNCLIKLETVSTNHLDYDEEPLECDMPLDGDDPFAATDNLNTCNFDNSSSQGDLHDTHNTRNRRKNKKRKNQKEPPKDTTDITSKKNEKIYKQSYQDLSQDEENPLSGSNESNQNDSTSEEEVKLKKLIKGRRLKQRDINRKKKAEIRIDYTMDAACAACDEKFYLFSTYCEHMLTAHVENQWKCVTCNRQLKCRYEFERHLRKHLPKNSIIKHICTICGLKLSCSTTLNRHLSVHSDNMQHLCEHCGRAFKRDTTLKAHMILHTGLKPYSCNFCQLSFACSSNCRRHMRKAHSEQFSALQTFSSKTQGKGTS